MAIVVTYLSMVEKLLILRSKILKLLHFYPLCLGSLSKDFAVGYMKASRLTGYVYDFSVDYWAIANDEFFFSIWVFSQDH